MAEHLMKNDWDASYGGWKDGDPLGYRLQETIEQNSMWCLYVRKDHRFHCPLHWDEAEQDRKKTESFCNTCWGLGVKVDPILVPCRISFFDTVVSPRHSDMRMEVGYLEYVTATVHFPKAVKPEKEDYLIQCEFDKPMQSIGKYPRTRIIKFNYSWVLKQTTAYYEREVGWSSAGLEPANFDDRLLKMALPFCQDIPILQLTNQWPAKDEYWKQS